MGSDAWRRQFPTGSVLDIVDLIDAVADLVADRVAERLDSSAKPAVEQMGFDLREAGAYLGCSAAHVSKMVDTGVIPALRLGGRVVISRAALDALLAGEDLAS